MKASEPAIAYNTRTLQNLKSQLVMAIDATKDIRKLQACLDLLQTETMPCVFSEEEFDEEIKASEQSGFATEEEVRTAFAIWGVYK